jgi:hypothetical protein
MKPRLLSLAVLLSLGACSSGGSGENPAGPGDPSPPNPPSVDNPPQLQLVRFEYDAVAQEARLTAQALDPDGTPVTISCSGAIDVAGSDSVTASLRVSQSDEVRPLQVTCIASSNGKTTQPRTAVAFVPVTGQVAYIDEIALQINQYRAQNGLSSVPVSKSLGFVALTHVSDLHNNRPHAPSQCNMHSWSSRGNWSACCYTPDHAQAQCMWNKPRELTAYPGNGFENAAGGGSDNMTAERALQLWRGSSLHNDVILNRGPWATHPWRAVGGGIHKGFAVVWFGEEVDPTD